MTPFGTAGGKPKPVPCRRDRAFSQNAIELPRVRDEDDRWCYERAGTTRRRTMPSDTSMATTSGWHPTDPQSQPPTATTPGQKPYLTQLSPSWCRGWYDRADVRRQVREVSRQPHIVTRVSGTRPPLRPGTPLGLPACRRLVTTVEFYARDEVEHVAVPGRSRPSGVATDECRSTSAG